MELWIRSQDREMITKIDYVYLETNNGREILGGNHYMINKFLGLYATKERALEVLDEIEGLLVLKQGLKLTTNAIYSVDNGLAIYEMPKD